MSPPFSQRTVTRCAPDHARWPRATTLENCPPRDAFGGTRPAPAVAWRFADDCRQLFAEPSTRPRASFELAAGAWGRSSTSTNALSSRARYKSPRHCPYAALDAGRCFASATRHPRQELVPAGGTARLRRLRRRSDSPSYARSARHYDPQCLADRRLKFAIVATSPSPVSQRSAPRVATLA